MHKQFLSPIDNSGNETPSNHSLNPHFADVLADYQQQRRGFLRGSLNLAVAAFMSGDQLANGPFGHNQMLVADPETLELRRFMLGPIGCEITGVISTPDLKTLFVNIQHPGEQSLPGRFTSSWPHGKGARPRSATVVIRKDDGGVIGT